MTPTFLSTARALFWNRVNPESELFIPVLLLILAKAELLSTVLAKDMHCYVVRLGNNREVLLAGVSLNNSCLIHRYRSAIPPRARRSHTKSLTVELSGSINREAIDLSA
jgi:hypothetical protein